MFKALKGLFTRKNTSVIHPAERGWHNIFDWNTGTWQQHTPYQLGDLLSFSPLFRCIHLIASDIAKMNIRLMSNQGSYWSESSRAMPVLRKPNHYQTRLKFMESWLQSKLIHGNTFILKGRDARGVVTHLYPLDPNKVKVLISDSSDVFYELALDTLNGIQETTVIAPAREIIHDVHVTFEHPLSGISPIVAASLSATEGLNIQKNSSKLFGNMSRPSGVLSAPGRINDETAARLKTSWDANYSGDNFGKVAVLGDDLKFQPMATNAIDAQLIEQLNWTAIDVCTAFGVPPYKIGVGDMPAYNNINALDQAYFGQTLQAYIEQIELLLDDGLSVGTNNRIELDTESLLRMDVETRAKVDKELISSGIASPNEIRARRNMPPVEGGNTPYLQQQNYSLAALAKRDAQEDPFSTSQPAPTDDEEAAPEEIEMALSAYIFRQVPLRLQHAKI